MILWRNIENYPFFFLIPTPDFPHFLLYVKWKSGVTFVRRCFRDEPLSLKNLPSGFQTRSDTNWHAPKQKQAGGSSFLDIESIPDSEQQRCWPDCAVVQADLCHCCLHVH